MDPWSRAKQKEEDIAKRDAREEPKVRTLIDLIRMAELDEEEVRISDNRPGRAVNTTLADLYEVLKDADPKKKDDGRLKLMARLKEVGVEKMSHRQKVRRGIKHSTESASIHSSKSADGLLTVYCSTLVSIAIEYNDQVQARGLASASEGRIRWRR